VICHGSCVAPRKPACCPGQVRGPSMSRFGSVHAVGDAVATRTNDVVRRGVTGPVAARENIVQIAVPPQGHCATRQRLVRSRQVTVFGMRHRANEGIVPRAGGQHRQMFADLKSRDGRVDRPEFPANSLRGLRLQVKRLVVAGPAGQENENDRLRRSSAERLARCGRTRTRQMLEDRRQSHDAGASGAQPVPAGESQSHLFCRVRRCRACISLGEELQTHQL